MHLKKLHRFDLLLRSYITSAKAYEHKKIMYIWITVELWPVTLIPQACQETTPTDFIQINFRALARDEKTAAKAIMCFDIIISLEKE